MLLDEVRRVGKSLGIDPELLGRHSIPWARIGHSHFRGYNSRKGKHVARSRCHLHSRP